MEMTKELLPYRVFDSDGEFLLIEAANNLPSWVSPSNAQNRVSNVFPEPFAYTEDRELRSGCTGDSCI